MEAIGTLAGGIAHDFNNILGAILGNVDLARLDPTDPQLTSECIEEIRRAGHRARNLVQQILTFSRHRSPERRALALAPVVDEAIALLRATLPAGIELVKKVQDPLPTILGDSNQI